MTELISLRPGQSVSGDEIPAFRTGPKEGSYCYLLAGTHGDEVEGVYVLQQLIKWIEEQDDLSFNMIIIPILNPDGFRKSTRTNAHGVDLNRNLPAASWTQEHTDKKYHPGTGPLSEPENKFLDDLMKKFPPHMILSFHTWKPMLNYNGDGREVAEFLERYNNYPICDVIKGHPTPGSLGEYASEHYQCPVLTFECPEISESLDLKSIWQENEAGLTALLSSKLLAPSN